MVSLYFDIRDIFRAVKLGFAAKKIWIHFTYLFYGLLIYDILTYIAAKISGYDLAIMWHTYHFFPCPFSKAYPMDFTVGGDILYWIGVAVMVILWFLASAAVGKITIEQLRGNDFYSRKEAFNFIKKNWKAVIFSPIALIILMVILFVGGMVVGAWQEIPYVGEITTNLLAIPIFIVSLFFVLLVAVIALSFIMTPAVVATTKNDTFETMFELFSSLTSQPWRIVIYDILLWIIAPLGTALFFIASFLGIKVMFATYYYASEIIHTPEKVNTLFAYAMQYLPNLPFIKSLSPCCQNFYNWLTLIPAGIPNFKPVFYETLNWSMHLSGFILGLTFTLILLFIASYLLTINSVGQVIIYTIVRKKKDDENLLEMLDEEFEEPIIPAIEEEEKKEEEKPETEKEEKVEKRKRGRPRKKKE
ncbi:MAG TPA: hypothetical protein ENG29_00775 [Firmicutes bacterium]|nr:hypothetical protein [Bacillota bacterium]